MCMNIVANVYSGIPIILLGNSHLESANGGPDVHFPLGRLIPVGHALSGNAGSGQ